MGVGMIAYPGAHWMLPVFAVLCLWFGMPLIVPIGGVGMSTVIALLNSYAGLPACAMGFAMDNS
jgi:NAD(P) transhydrogenase subunit beta